MDARGELVKTLPNLNPDILNYCVGFINDTSEDHTLEAMIEFLEPLLEMDMELLTQFCARFAVADADTSIKTLDTFLVMKDFNQQEKKRVDLQHIQGRTAVSLVNQKKLRQAEKKIQAKREKRQLNGEIMPEWNPLVKPAIIVNQVKSQATLDSRSKDIKLENFDIQYAGKKILQNANLLLAYGRRYGLVGKNGVGKSTLLRAIANKELSIPSHMRILHVEQEMSGDDTPALTSVMLADEERTQLLKEEKMINSKLNTSAASIEETEELNQRLKAVYQRMEEIGADQAESRAASILNGLGFTQEQQTAPTKSFSGGWRMRLSLARVLFCRHSDSISLLDEITNHLDFSAIVWLENYLIDWPGTLLIVSHDKSFLNAVCTDILHMNGESLTHYRGTFTDFVATRAERRRNEIREYEAQLQYRQHLQDFIDRWRYNAKRAAQAQSKIKILEKLPPLVPPKADEMEGLGEGSLYFRFPEPEGLSPPILQMDGVTFGYNPEKTILRNVSLDVRMDSKVAIVGPNGAGKSTLVRLLMQELQPSKGIVNRHGRLRIALFSQHHVDQLELALSSVAFLAKQVPDLPEEEYRRYLGRFGLTGMSALQPIGTLSGGQKSRVAFAWMALQNPHIIIADEITNHLDMDSIDALGAAFREFKGGIVLVSHDEEFLDAVCNEVWVCHNGNFSRFEGKEGVQIGIVKQYKQSLQ